MIWLGLLWAAVIGLVCVIAYAGGLEQGRVDGWNDRIEWEEAQRASSAGRVLHPSSPAPDVDELEAMWRRPPPPYDWQREGTA